MKKICVSVLFIVLFIIIGVGVISGGDKIDNNYAAELEINSSESTIPDEISINITIKGYSEEGIDVNILRGESVVDVLEKLQNNDNSLNLQIELYEGLGVLVKGIGDYVNGQDGKYWQYNVNGIMPMVGADKYVLEDGDKIVWFFDKSEF